MCLLLVLRLFLLLLTIMMICDYFLNYFLNYWYVSHYCNFFFGTNYLLLFEGITARSMRVGVSTGIGAPLALGLDCQVFGLTSCVRRPN